MAKKESTKFLTIIALIEKIRATCKKRLKETTEDNVSIFSISFAEDFEWSIRMDHSSNRILISLSRPMIKLREEFALKDLDVLVGVNYIEFYNSDSRFIHLDFDQYNITKEEEVIPNSSSKKIERRKR